MKIKLLSILGAVSLLVLAGCSGNPGADDVQKIFQGKIKNQSAGRIKLLSVLKTDGIAENYGGVKVYRISYKAEIEFLEDCYWGPFEFDGSWSGNFHTTPGKPNDLSFFSPQYMGKKKVAKGDRKRLSGDMQFVKTENGWQAQQ